MTGTTLGHDWDTTGTMKVLSLKANIKHEIGIGWSFHIEYYTIADDAKTMFINTLDLPSEEVYMEVLKMLIDSQVTDKYNPSKDTVSTIKKRKGE